MILNTAAGAFPMNRSAGPSESSKRAPTSRFQALTDAAELVPDKLSHGLCDVGKGRVRTSAAIDFLRAKASGMRVDLVLACERVQSYRPEAGTEHCPNCWVCVGSHRPLVYACVPEADLEVGTCNTCAFQAMNQECAQTGEFVCDLPLHCDFAYLNDLTHSQVAVAGGCQDAV